MDIEELKLSLQRSSEETMKAMKELSFKQRFNCGTKNFKRLERALGITRLHHLKDKTLISPNIHRKHSRELKDLLFKELKKIRRRCLKIAQIARELKLITRTSQKVNFKNVDEIIYDSCVRFFTLIDSVCAVNADDAILLAAQLKNELIKAIQSFGKISCIGAIEAEVIPASKINDHKKLKPQVEHRKLDSIESLIDYTYLIEHIVQPDSSVFVIHFHGVIFAKNEKQFDNFRNQLKLNPRWTQSSRQIELKKLSRSWIKTTRSLESNLESIASYMVKGSNDLIKGNCSFRYKVEPSSEDDFVSKNYLDFEQERIEDGIVDSLSLSVEEIAEQVKFVDMLMDLDNTRTGYLIKIIK